MTFATAIIAQVITFIALGILWHKLPENIRDWIANHRRGIWYILWPVIFGIWILLLPGVITPILVACTSEIVVTWLLGKRVIKYAYQATKTGY